MRYGLAIIALVAVASLLTSCSCQQTTPVPQSQQPPPEQAQPEPVWEPPKLVQSSGRTLDIPVFLARQQFSPTTTNVNAGDTVNILITAVAENHIVSVPAFNIQTAVAAGNTRTVSFTPIRKGENISVLCIDQCDSGVQLLVLVQ